LEVFERPSIPSHCHRVHHRLHQQLWQGILGTCSEHCELVVVAAKVGLAADFDDSEEQAEVQWPLFAAVRDS
jgi:hypothetical protein